MLTAKNHLPVTRQVADDLVKLIDQSPAAFDLMIFKANIDELEDITGQDDPVGNLEARERTLSYSHPLISKGVMLPTEQTGLSMLAPGFDALDSMDEPVQVIVKEPHVPEQSVFWYEEQITEEQTKVTLLYVLRSEPIGINGQSGSIHWLMPFSQGVETLGKVSHDDDGLPQWNFKPEDALKRMLSTEQSPEPETPSESPEIAVMGDVIAADDNDSGFIPEIGDNPAADIGSMADFMNSMVNK